MAANVLRLRRSLAITSSILNYPRHFSSSASSVAALPSSSPSTIRQNPSLFNVTQLKANSLGFEFISSRYLSSRSRYNNDDMDGDQISPDAILFEGCDYNHWLITMDFPKDPKPSPEEMVETYVQTAAKVLGSVEEAKKKIYACSTTTYNGFQVEVSEEVSEQFKGLPGVVFVLPDSYIDPVNKEYGGDKYINGTIIPRPPPVQYGRQGGRYNDRNRDYNRPPRGGIEQNNAPGGGNYQGDRRGSMPPYQAPGGGNYQGDRRGSMPTYQADYNQGEGRSINPARQPDFPQRDQGNYTPSEQRDFRRESGNFNSTPVGGGGGSYRQGTGGQYGQGRGGQYGQGGGGSYGQGIGQQYGQSGGDVGGQYGQGGGGNYGQGAGGQYGQGRGGFGQGTGGQYSQGGGYGQGTGGQYGQGGGYVQGTGGQYGQGGVGNYGQRTGGQFGGGSYGQGIGSGNNRTSSQYGEDPKFTQGNTGRQQGNYEVIEEAEAIKEN